MSAANPGDERFLNRTNAASRSEPANVARIGARRSPRRGAPRLPNSSRPGLRGDPLADEAILVALGVHESRVPRGGVWTR